VGKYGRIKPQAPGSIVPDLPKMEKK